MAVAQPAVFLTGSIRRHVLVTTATNAVGYMAILGIDLLSMFYVSRGGHLDQMAAVSLTSKFLFFPYAVFIGLTTALVARLSRAIGRGERERDEAALALSVFGATAVAISFLAWLLREPLLALFGARGNAATIASQMLAVMLPGHVLLAVGMAASGVLRAFGDVRRSMLASVAGAAFAAVADPVLILGLELGAQGAAWSTAGARLAFALVAVACAWQRLPCRWLALPAWRELAPPYLAIAGPAILTQLALPFADWYTTLTLWGYGVEYASAAGVFDRIMPLAFAVVFSLTGAVGPIIGQNLGAQAFDRIGACFREALKLVALYAMAVWVLLALLAPLLAAIFALQGEARDFFLFLCRLGTGVWFSVAVLFVSNVVFNTLGRATYAAAFNWGRATLGTIPFVWIGSRTGGIEAAILWLGLSALLFAVGGALLASRLIHSLGRNGACGCRPPADSTVLMPSGKASCARASPGASRPSGGSQGHA